MLTFEEVQQAIEAHGKENILVYDIKRVSGKHILTEKGRNDKKAKCTWIPLNFVNSEGKEVRPVFKTKEIFLPQGAMLNTHDKKTEYGRHSVLNIRIRAVTQDKINVMSNFLGPDEQVEDQEVAKFDSLSTEIFTNNQEFIQILDAIEASIQKQFAELGKLDVRTSGFKPFKDPVKFKTIKVGEYEDSKTFEKVIYENPIYFVHLHVEKNEDRPPYIGYRTPPKNDIVPVVYDLSKQKDDGTVPLAMVKDEEGKLEHLTYFNASKFINPGSLAIMVLEVDRICIYNSGMRVHLLVKDMKVLNNKAMSTTVPRITAKDTGKLTSLMRTIKIKEQVEELSDLEDDDGLLRDDAL
jgi:hypothetical protein